MTTSTTCDEVINLLKDKYKINYEYDENRCDSIDIDGTKAILLLDFSYYIFYRYFALCSWWKKAQEDELIVDKIIHNNIFIEKYDKLFYENIKKIQKKYDIKDSIVIFGKDCRRYNIWRNKYYEDYKKTRDDNNRNFNRDIFLYTYYKIVPELQEKGIKFVSIDNAEGDDIIAILKKTIRERYNTLPIYIITNDHDYLQLIDDNTFIYNLKSYDLRNKSKGSKDIDLKLKILKGDISDNIVGINKSMKITEKKLMEYIKDCDKLDKLLNDNPNLKKIYDRNELLINFDKIPDDIQKKIRDCINFVEINE